MSNKAQRNKKKRKFKFTAPGILVSAIMVVVNLAFLITLLHARLLPVKILLPVCLVILALLALEVFLVSNHKKKARFRAGFIISLVMTIVLVLGGLYLTRGIQALNKITSGEQVDYVDVYVLEEDPAQELSDAADYTFGVFKSPDYDHIEETIAHINEKLDTEIHVNSYRKLTDMIDALMDEEINAIITREGYLGLLDDTKGYETARGQLRSIYQMEFRDKITEEKPERKGNAFTVYISGIDTYGGVSNKSRSDVNILATVNPDTHQILLISTPRDYYVPLSISDGIPDKLTHAGIYGVDVSMDTMEMIYDVNVDYFFRVNFSGFEDIIDSLGGITVHSDYSFSAGGYYFEAGENTMNGEKALMFARERHSFSEGDRQRGRNQMAIIQAVMKKAMSPDILKNYQSLLDAVEGNFQTSVPYDLIASLVRAQLSSGADWNVVSYSVNGTGGQEIPYSMSTPAYVMYPDQATVNTAKGLMEQILDGEIVSEPQEQK